ncbi:MAG: hypothetical protein WED07_03710 [Candidatus Freyarchaeum deiterrae]
MSETTSLDNLTKLVELNLGRWKPEAVVIIDVNHKMWSGNESVSRDLLDYYYKFPLSEMHAGDSISNSKSFFMKVTEKTGVIVVMEDPHLARLAAINLNGRLNALSDFYTLEKVIDDKNRPKSVKRAKNPNSKKHKKPSNKKKSYSE